MFRAFDNHDRTPIPLGDGGSHCLLAPDLLHRPCYRRGMVPPRCLPGRQLAVVLLVPDRGHRIRDRSTLGVASPSIVTSLGLAIGPLDGTGDGHRMETVHGP